MDAVTSTCPGAGASRVQGAAVRLGCFGASGAFRSRVNPPFDPTMISQAVLAFLDHDGAPGSGAAAEARGFDGRVTAEYSPLMDPACAAKRELPPVLIVDDEPTMLRTIGRILKRRGYRTVAAGDGRAAVELCLQHRPSLVFLDLSMPHCNGAQVLRELRERLAQQAPPVVIVTGSVSAEHVTNLGGAVAFVDKPFTHQQIVEIAERFAPARPSP